MKIQLLFRTTNLGIVNMFLQEKHVVYLSESEGPIRSCLESPHYQVQAARSSRTNINDSISHPDERQASIEISLQNLRSENDHRLICGEHSIQYYPGFHQSYRHSTLVQISHFQKLGTVSEDQTPPY